MKAWRNLECFMDRRDPKPRSREASTFHRFETMAGMALKAQILRCSVCTDFRRLESAGIVCTARSWRSGISNVVREVPSVRASFRRRLDSGKTFTADHFAFIA